MSNHLMAARFADLHSTMVNPEGNPPLLAPPHPGTDLECPPGKSRCYLFPKLSDSLDLPQIRKRGITIIVGYMGIPMTKEMP